MDKQRLQTLLDAQSFLDNYAEVHQKGKDSDELHQMIVKYYEATKIIERLLMLFEITIKSKE